MVTRDKVLAEIDKVPDDRLDELYRIIRDLELKPGAESELGAMTRLRQIRISAAPDLSTKANLYELEPGNAE